MANSAYLFDDLHPTPVHDFNVLESIEAVVQVLSTRELAIAADILAVHFSPKDLLTMPYLKKASVLVMVLYELYSPPKERDTSFRL